MQKRTVLIVAILASFIAFLDGSVINVALPAISDTLGGGLALQQWVVDAYLLTLGSLILIAGSLSDLFGRKRILTWGLIGFGVTSLMCAVAPSGTMLIVSRALQGVAGALLVPSSLALIIATFKGQEQAKAIGSWTAWTGIAFVIGPLLGGLLVDLGSWRYVFAINVFPIILTLALLAKLDDTARTTTHPRVDYTGALLCTIGLAGPVFAFIEQPRLGWSDARVILPLIAGIAALYAFVIHERRTKQPMVPFGLFTVRNFLFGNLATISIYGGLSVSTFLISVFLQQVAGYGATEAGMALLPITIIMFLFSSRVGALAGRYGPRIFMTTGPLISALGSLLFLRMSASPHYITDVLPGVVVFGAGLCITVAPLTSAVLGTIDSAQAGIASAINNAVARIAGLVAIAAIGLVVGSQITVTSFRGGLFLMTSLLAIGGLISFVGIRTESKTQANT